LFAATDLFGLLGDLLLALLLFGAGRLVRRGLRLPLRLGRRLRLLLRQAFGAGRVGLVAFELPGQLVQLAGRVLHRLLRFGAGRLGVGRLFRLVRCLGSLGLALWGLRRVQVLGFLGDLLLLALDFLCL